MSKQSLWPIVLEQCNVCMTYAATLCNPFATLMKVGGGERGENCIVLEQCNVCMTYAATLCNPFATLMKVGGGERGENCV